MTPDTPEACLDAALYPAGHLAGLTLEALIAERDRQREQEERALRAWEIDTATAAAARARLCTQEMIRRRLAALAPTEQAQ